LQAVSHLANSSKHFDQLSQHHQSVNTSGSSGAFFGGGFFGGGFFGSGNLMIEFKGHAVNVFGKSKTAIEFAEMALAFWETKAR
jgi:hypothetical protein